jgi:hypothetical protein
MTPTERIQLITELRRAFPSHQRLHEALMDYETLAIAMNRAPKSPIKATNSRAAYMREHRKKERALIRKAKGAESVG